MQEETVIDPKLRWLTAIIKQVELCTFEIFNITPNYRNISRMVRAVRGLMGLMDQQGKEKYKAEIKKYQDFEKGQVHISYMEIEKLFNELISYFYTNIFKDHKGAWFQNPNPDHIGDRKRHG